MTAHAIRHAATPAETLTMLQAFVSNRPEPPRPTHPATGCWCDPCVGRDSALESRAEDMAAVARGDYMSARDQDALDWRAGG